MTLAVVPGSFDPFTRGHLDLVRRTAALFDQVLVAVAVNTAKTAMFTQAERIELIRASLAPQDERVAVVAVTGLLAEFAKGVGANAIVKGIRGETDLSYEVPMALLNRQISGVETAFVLGDPALGHISSTAVKEIAHLGGDITGFVTPAVGQVVQAKVRLETSPSTRIEGKQ